MNEEIAQNPEYSSLQKFDEYYKNNKNVIHEAYYYKKPRINTLLYQVSPDDLVADINNKNEMRDNGKNYYLNYYFFNVDNSDTEDSPGPQFNKLFDLSQISENDFNYYMKLVSFLKDEYNANPLLKGMHNCEEKAIKLLKECHYDVQLSLKKILFPSTFIDSQRPLLFNRSASVMLGNNCGMNHQSSRGLLNELPQGMRVAASDVNYVNSALHDLIGSNIQEKEEWLNLVEIKISNGIDYSDLQRILEIGGKLKIEIPDRIIKEIEFSYEESKKIKKFLSEKNTLADLEKHFSRIEQLKIRTDEYYALKEAISKSRNWKEKANQMLEQMPLFKNLQNIFNEGKNLPVKFPEFEEIKSKYFKALGWQEKYSTVPKHSKTRQGIGGRINERTSLQTLKELIDESETICFTSSEVALLKSNYKQLLHLENLILMSLEDIDACSQQSDLSIGELKRNKDMITDFLNQLDYLKFNTSLYYELVLIYEFLDWKERKDLYLQSKGMKIKQLKQFVTDGIKKRLDKKSKEVYELRDRVEAIDDWINKMTSMFISSGDDDKDEYSIEELNELNEASLGFPFCTEETEFINSKVDEINEFAAECSLALNNQVFNQEKLESLKEKISKYKIKCPQFNLVSTHMNEIQSWFSCYDNIIDIYNCKRELATEKLPLNGVISFSTRQKLLSVLNELAKFQSKFNIEIINRLISSSPSNALQDYKLDALKLLISEFALFEQNNAETLEKLKTNPEEISLTNIFELLEESKEHCLSNSFFEFITSQLKVKSLCLIIRLDRGPQDDCLTFNQAETLLKDLVSYNLCNSPEYEKLKNCINQTKEWLKQHKKICSTISPTNKISMETLSKLLHEGISLTLLTDELNQLIIFFNSLQNMLHVSKQLCNGVEKIPYKNLESLYSQISNLSIEVPEFEVLIHLFKVSLEWKDSVNKLLNSRSLCTLYFKIDEEIKEIEPNQIQVLPVHDEIGDISSNQLNQIYQLTDSQQLPEESTNSKADPKFLNKKRNKPKENNEKEFGGRATGNRNTSSKKITSLKQKEEQVSSQSSDLLLNNQDDHQLKDSKKKKKENEGSSIVENKQHQAAFNSSFYTNGPQTDNLYLASCFDNIRMKQFNTLSYKDKISILSQKVQIKEDNKEQFCICRRNDDGVNFMIGCEYCKEWFHGACLRIPKYVASKGNPHVCTFCLKRYDIQPTATNEYLLSKRMTIHELEAFIQDGLQYPVFFEEMTELIAWREKYYRWQISLQDFLSNYDIKLQGYYSAITEKSFELSEQTQKDIISKFLETEGFPIEVENSIFCVILLKHYDWFNEASKCYDVKRSQEKALKKLFTSFDRLFTKSTEKLDLSEPEKKYILNISMKASDIYKELENRYGVFTHIQNLIKSPKYASYRKELEMILDQFNQDSNFLVSDIDNYFIFKKRIIEELESMTASPSNYENDAIGISILNPSILVKKTGSTITNNGEIIADDASNVNETDNGEIVDEYTIIAEVNHGEESHQDLRKH